MSLLNQLFNRGVFGAKWSVHFSLVLCSSVFSFRWSMIIWFWFLIYFFHFKLAIGQRILGILTINFLWVCLISYRNCLIFHVMMPIVGLWVPRSSMFHGSISLIICVIVDTLIKLSLFWWFEIEILHYGLFCFSWIMITGFLQQNMLDIGNLSYQIVAKQKRFAAQTHAKGNCTIFACRPRSNSSNSGNISVLISLVSCLIKIFVAYAASLLFGSFFSFLFLNSFSFCAHLSSWSGRACD